MVSERSCVAVRVRKSVRENKTAKVVRVDLVNSIF